MSLHSRARGEIIGIIGHDLTLILTQDDFRAWTPSGQFSTLNVHQTTV